MANPSRRLFDLDEAARLSKLISSRAPARSRRPLVERPPPRPEPRGKEAHPIPELRSDRASNATELWVELLSWCRDAFGCSWVFALDDRGFMIAETKYESPLPPEVFSEVNAAMARLFHDYLPEGQGLRSASLDFSLLGPVSLLPLDIDESAFLLGLWNTTHIEEVTVDTITRVFTDELRAFEERVAVPLELEDDEAEDEPEAVPDGDGEGS